ncbi:hypothetical protein ACFL6N_06095 [Thermodesulfobacteriota bacterium]
MTHTRIKILVIILLLPFLVGFGAVNHETINTSLINLIATPDKFHGKIVRVIGVSNIEFEGNGIYLSKEHLINRVTKNALWLSLNFKIIGKSEEELSKYNGQYVLVEGVFNKDDKGHMGLKSGSINNVTRFMPWPPAMTTRQN